jgi:hypothetical protein
MASVRAWTRTQVGLINARGRVYDPKVGRFLTTAVCTSGKAETVPLRSSGNQARPTSSL